MFRVTTLRCATLVLLAGALPQSAPAQGLPQRVLFIGSSLTHGHYDPVRTYNAKAVVDEDYGLPAGNPRREAVAGEDGPFGGIPGIFKKFADEKGYPYDVHLETITGKTLEYQSVYGMRIIAQHWDDVIVQDESTIPLPPDRGGHIDNFLEFATSVEMKIHATSPDAQAFLFQTWPRADLTYRTGAPYFGQNIDAMGRDLHYAYYKEFTTDRHFQAVAPAGDAWLLAMERGVARVDPRDDSKLDLWNDDWNHPSVWGAYLSACVIFETVTGREATALGRNELAAHDLGILPDDATSLQGIAHEQVLASEAAGR